MDPIDSRQQSLKEIKEWADSFGQTLITESDTRFKIIDRVLTEALGWKREDVLTEEIAGEGRLDYKLMIDGATRLIVEAKKEAVSFDLAHRQTGQAYKLNGAVFKGAADAAIRQVISYCAFKNAELACATNGAEWIIFRANRLGDGKDTLDGKGFVFASLADVLANFAQFHDLLSHESVKGLKFRGMFQEVEGLPLRDFSFSRKLRTPDTKRLLDRSSFAIDFDSLMDSFFQRLTGEEDEEMVVDCFVVTRESELADKKLSRVAEDLVLRMREVNSQTGTELIELIESVQRQNRHRFVLLVGNKGAGKSTFVDRFFRFVLPANVAGGIVTIRLNLGLSDGAPDGAVQWLNRELLKICEEAVYSDEGPNWDETIGAMFFDEYQRWSRGSMRHLYESDKGQFKIEFGRHIEQLRKDDPREYIKRLLRHIVRSRKRVPCLVFDNTDHHNIRFQEAVFQYARSIYESELCVVITPITDTTSWQLSRQGALQSFESEVLYLPVPPPHRVIERRIAYITKKLSDENHEKIRDYFFGRNIRLDIKSISAFASSLSRIFVETKRTSEWLGGLVNYDIRRLLELTRDVIASPHLPLEELLKAHLTGSSISIQEWRTKSAIIKRRYDIYPEGEHHFVQNIYQFNEQTPTSPLLAVRTLQYLRDVQPVDGRERAFASIEAVVDHLAALGFEQRPVSNCVQWLLEKGLVLEFDPTVMTVQDARRIELSPAGKVHLIWGTADEDYVKAMKDVTPIRDRQVYDSLAYFLQNASATWAKALATFIDYLIGEDSYWCRVPAHSVFDGQRAVTRRLQQVRNSVSRFAR